MPMLLAYSTNAFTKMDLLSALSQIADLGYSGAEILCEKPHWFPEDVNESQIIAVSHLLQEKKISISNLNANTANSCFSTPPPENVFEPSLTNKDSNIRQKRIELVKKSIKFASKIGARSVSLTSGRPMPGCLPDQGMNYFIDSLKRICETAHQYNVPIGIEYEPGLIVETATEVLEVIERVNSEQLGVNLDLGHSYLNREDPVSTVLSFKNRIWNVHIEDIKNMKHFHLVPGDGDMPLNEYLTALKKIDYQGFLTVELYSFPENPLEVGKRSLDYLSKLLTQISCDAE